MTESHSEFRARIEKEAPHRLPDRATVKRTVAALEESIEKRRERLKFAGTSGHRLKGALRNLDQAEAILAQWKELLRPGSEGTVVTWDQFDAHPGAACRSCGGFLSKRERFETLDGRCPECRSEPHLGGTPWIETT